MILIGDSDQSSDVYANVYKLNDSVDAFAILPYLPNNIISNLNEGSNQYGYVRHIVSSEMIDQEHYKEWIENDAPDLIIGDIHQLYLWQEN